MDRNHHWYAGLRETHERVSEAQQATKDDRTQSAQERAQERTQAVQDIQDCAPKRPDFHPSTPATLDGLGSQTVSHDPCPTDTQEASAPVQQYQSIHEWEAAQRQQKAAVAVEQKQEPEQEVEI